MTSLRGSALLVCDMWDRHWCATATERTAAVAVQINGELERLRPALAFVIHAPSNTMRFYKGTSQRARMANAELIKPMIHDVAEPPAPRTIHEGCPDDPSCPAGRPPWPWTRQHPAIRIDEADGVSDVGAEVYSALRDRNIDRLIFTGVHTDQCVLDRSFGIRQMRAWGVECALLSDLTEAFWSDETNTILDHIDRYLCPVISSADLGG